MSNPNQHSGPNFVGEAAKAGALTAVVGATALIGAEIMTSNDLNRLFYQFPQMPYNETAQQVVSNLDIAVGVPGFVGLCITTGLIASNRLAAKFGGRQRAARAEMIHKLSSRELVASGRDKGRRTRSGNWLGTGRLPVITAAGVAVAALCNMIGNEITDGPQRPIDSIVSEVGADNFKSLIVQDVGANPMGDSAIGQEAIASILVEAEKAGVTAVPISKNLGTVQVEDSGIALPGLATIGDGESTKATLAFGLPVERGSELAYEDKTCSQPLPVYVDNSAIFIPYNGTQLNGMYIQVVGEKSDISAMNRIGVVADAQGLACITKNANAHIIGLDTDPETAATILQTAAPNEVATVISLEDYKNNSREFWKGNSKPITNVVALLAMLMAGAATGGNLLLRVEKSRREMAALMASGVKAKTLRTVEALRVAKDTVVATASGVVGAAAVAPIISSAVFGLQLQLSPKDVLVGAGAAIIGAATSFARTFGSKKRILKAIDPSEATQ
jgi:hypothetical protein